MKVDLLGLDGKVKGKIELEKKVFNAEISTGAIYTKFVNENANIHIGTAMKKNRAMARGGGRKPWRQKGTGRARAGTIRSPIWRGGGRAFGGQRKIYKFNIPKKLKLKAIASTITAKLKQGVIKFIEEIKVSSGKTKEFIKKISKIADVQNEKVVLITASEDKTLLRSTKNLKNLKILNAKRLKIIPLIDSKKILITESAVEYINKLGEKLVG